MTTYEDLPEPPRTEWGGFAVLSEADVEDDDVPDPEEYEDWWGAVQDEENWKQIQRKVLEEGTYDERPETAPFDGAKYHATDAGAVFEWDDDAGEWRVLNSGSEEQPLPDTLYREAVESSELSTEQIEALEETISVIGDLDLDEHDLESVGTLLAQQVGASDSVVDEGYFESVSAESAQVESEPSEASDVARLAEVEEAGTPGDVQQNSVLWNERFAPGFAGEVN